MDYIDVVLGKILGVWGEGFSSKCISFPVFLLVIIMLWGGGWVGWVCNVDFSCRYKNMFCKQTHCASAAYTKSEKDWCQKLSLSERGRYPKKILWTCFIWIFVQFSFRLGTLGLYCKPLQFLKSFFIIILLIWCTKFYLKGSSHREWSVWSH